jgi:hypothetical protein
MGFDELADDAPRPGGAIPGASSDVGSSAAIASSRARRRRNVLIVLFIACALYYVIRYVPASGNGSDFQVFYAVGYASVHHVDPFDWPALWRVEQIVYNGGVGHSGPVQFAPYADMPPWELVLRPLTVISESAAFRIWAAILIVLAGIGGFLALRGWPFQQRMAGSVLVALCPAALFDIRVGQDSLPQVLTLGLGMYLIHRRMPVAAGLAMAVGCYKPHLSIPVALIVTLWAGRSNARKVFAGLVAGWLAYIAIGIIFDGGATTYLHWLGSVHNFGASIRNQPDLASIPGLYLGRMGSTVSWILNVLCLLLAGLIILVLYAFSNEGTAADRQRLLGGGIATYLAFSPYVHTTDQTLLTIPLLLLIGFDGSGLRDTAVLLAAVTAMLAPLVVLTDYHTVGINALPPICVALAYFLHTETETKASEPSEAKHAPAAEFETARARG